MRVPSRCKRVDIINEKSRGERGQSFFFFPGDYGGTALIDAYSKRERERPQEKK